MKYLLIISLYFVLIGCSQATQKQTKETIPISTPSPIPNTTNINLEIEESIVRLDKTKKENVQFVKNSLDYLVEHTISNRQEIADITNKIVPELNKSGVKSSREEFLWVCKVAMQVNNVEEKLGEKPDFAVLASYVAGDLETNRK